VNRSLNRSIFFPPFLLLLLAVIVSLIDATALVEVLDDSREWIWGSAEPLYHLHLPPSVDIVAQSEEAAIVSMATLYMHWTFSPYALYTLVSLAFALAYYQYRLPFRVSSILRVYHSRAELRWYHDIIDAICLFALVAGMAASLGAGVLTISGGVEQLWTIGQGPILWGIIVLTIVIAFVTSAASGLKRGIKWLSLINMCLFVVMILTFGGLLMTGEGWRLSLDGLLDYILHFVPRSIGLSHFDQSWEQSWTSFYWANWMAWAPVTALFLGRLGQGRTVREFIRVNLLYTSLFSMLWMSIFGGISITLDLNGGHELYGILASGGPQDVIFDIVNKLPLSKIAGLLLLLIVYISYVTAADSNTSAMSGLSTRDINPDRPEAPLSIKVMWGLLISIMSWVMISFAGIDGIKILSVLGGFPVLFLCIAIVVIFIIMIRSSFQISSSTSEQD